MLLFLFVIGVAIAGYSFKALSLSGAIAASFVGTCIVIGLQGEGLLLLGVFFGTSSLWSKYKSKVKSPALQIVEKGEARDYGQVLANGLIPALCSMMYAWTNHELWIFTFAVSLAAANADTWASEIGTLSKKDPIHILTLQRVNRGTSGAVSLLGLLSTIGGSFAISITAFLAVDSITIVQSLSILLFGSAGSIADTILGATLQAKYHCHVCGIYTEKLIHCNQRTNLHSGFRWINNDVINFSSIMIAVIISVIFFTG